MLEGRTPAVAAAIAARAARRPPPAARRAESEVGARGAASEDQVGVPLPPRDHRAALHEGGLRRGELLGGDVLA